MHELGPCNSGSSWVSVRDVIRSRQIASCLMAIASRDIIFISSHVLGSNVYVRISQRYIPCVSVLAAGQCTIAAKSVRKSEHHLRRLVFRLLLICASSSDWTAGKHRERCRGSAAS